MSAVRPLGSWILIVGLAATAILGGGCEDTAQGPLVGVLRGTVVLSDRRSPGGAIVELDEGGPTASVVVGADGKFAFESVSPGAHTLRARLDGYEDAEVSVDTRNLAANIILLLSPMPRNGRPVISSLVATPAAVAPGGLVVLSSFAHDPDGDSLTYSWQVPAGWTLESGGAEASMRAPPAHGAEGIASLEVSDGRGGSATASVRISTAANLAPIVVAVSANPPQAAPGGTIALFASGTDPEGQPLSYTWSAPSSWILTVGTNDTATATLTAPNLAGDVATITVVANDGTRSSSPARLVVSTRENEAPTIHGISASENPVRRGGMIGLTVSASDPNGATLSYRWEVMGAGWTLLPTGAQASLIAPDTPGSTATVTVEASDGEKRATASLVVSTRANRLPGIDLVQATPNPVARGGTTILSAAVFDPDGDPLTHAWSIPTGTGWSLAAAGTTATLTAPPMSDAAIAVTLTVADPFGGQAVQQTVVTTPSNARPVIASVVATPNPVPAGGTATLFADASDPDGDPLTFAWSLPAGSAWSLVGAGSTVTLTAPAAPSVSTTVTVTVTDGGGATATRQVVVSTRSNAAPEISTLAATPNPLARGGTATLTAGASDPDGDPLTYAWGVSDAAWSLSGAGPSVTLHAPDSSSATAIVTVTVADPAGAQASRQVAVATRSNAAPVIASLLAVPNPVARGGTVALSALASDPDGDSLSFAWSVSPAGWTLSGSGAAVTLTAPDQALAVATVTLTVSDGLGGQAARQQAVSTSANRLPVVTSVTATPNPVARGGDIALQANASDPDTDPLSYTWSVSDPAWSLTGSGAAVTAKAPALPGATATVTVRIDDGGGGIVTQQVPVSTVPNRPPVLTLAPQTDGPIHSRTYQLLAVAQDGDGDPVTYGLEGAPASVTLDASTGALLWIPKLGDVGSFSFFITASDGFDVTRTHFTGTVLPLGFRSKRLEDGFAVRYPDNQFDVSFLRSGVAVADLDGDGRPDFAATDRYGNVAVTFTTASGFGESRFFFADRTLDSCTRIEAREFDGAAGIDLVVLCRNPDAGLVLWRNDGSGGFTRATPNSFADITFYEDLSFGDFDGDQRIDAFLRDDDAILVAKNDGGGAFSKSSTLNLPFSCTAGAAPAECQGSPADDCSQFFSRVAPGNFDADPALELAAFVVRRESFFCDNGFFERQATELRIYDVSPAGELTLASTHPAGVEEPGSVAAVDLDGDGDNDLVLVTHEGTLLLGENSAGSFSFASKAIAPFEGSHLAVRDIDQDGTLDVLYAGGGGFVIHFGEPNLTFSSATLHSIDAKLGCETISLAVAHWDLDPGGAPDVLHAAQCTDPLGVLKGKGGGPEPIPFLFLSY